jgi:hypothetical protein
MKGDQIVRDLVKELREVADLTVTTSSISRMGRVFQLDGKFNGLIYLGTRAEYPHHWGITKNTIDNIETQRKPWCVILLHDSAYTGYVISSAEYHSRIAKNVWPYHQGGYKITEGKSLVSIPHFSSIDELVNLLTTQLAETFSISSTIQIITQKMDILRRQGTEGPKGESTSHKELKEYVASHPEILGLKGKVYSFLEFSFPSGDQADIAFDLGCNCWAVVEIELEGLLNTLVGLFQAVKYRALQQAVLRAREIEGKVDGFLVARSVPRETKYCAKLLDIKVAEVML